MFDGPLNVVRLLVEHSERDRFADVTLATSDARALLAEIDRQAAAVERLEADKARLDWLDAVNTRTNERNGSRYGWRYDINHNRAALTDHNFPPKTVREAIDAARASLTETSNG